MQKNKLNLYICFCYVINFCGVVTVVSAMPDGTILGFKPCDPGQNDPMCHAIGQFGAKCSDMYPCARGLYCKRRSHGSFVCDNGVEETHQRLKDLLSGCLSSNHKSSKVVENDLEITAREIKNLVSSYYLTGDEENYLEDENFLRGANLKSGKGDKNFCSVQEAVGDACNQKRGCVKSQRLEAINTRLIDEVIGNQTSLPSSANLVSFYRPDKQSPLDLRRKGGFFSINPLSLSHARLMAPLLAGFPMDADIMEEFRKLNREPLILTTVKNEYKPRFNSKMLLYKLNLPIPVAQLQAGSNDPAANVESKRHVVYNGDSLETSQIIGVRSGNDVSFLTGISASFIRGVDFNDGKSFVEMPQAMKHFEELANDKKKHQEKQDSGSEKGMMPLLPDQGKDDENDK